MSAIFLVLVILGIILIKNPDDYEKPAATAEENEDTTMTGQDEEEEQVANLKSLQSAFYSVRFW